MTEISESHTDLLIIGAGPAGLIAAAWARQYNVSTRIIDKRAARVPNGHADGVHARTLEIFDSFGFVEQPLKEGFHEIEICSWVGLTQHSGFPSVKMTVDTNNSLRIPTSMEPFEEPKGSCHRNQESAGSKRLS